MATGLALTVDAIPGQTIGLVDEDGNARKAFASLTPVLTPADGTYRYQPLVWDDGTATWIPAPSEVRAQIFGSELGGTSRLQGDTGVTVQAIAGTALVQSNSNAVPKAALFLENDGANGFATLLVNADDNNNYTLLNADAVGGIPHLGFLGAAAVARQSITGVLTQDQVNSIVTALVNLGLVTDDR